MFNKKSTPKKPASPDPIRKPTTGRSTMAQAPSILGNDLVITGDIITDGDVQIEGRVDGNVKALTLTIGEQGAVNGTIKAGTAHIRGKVTGKIEAGTVELSETANVLADIIQDHLSIANGAFFDGKCARRTKPTPPTPLAPKK